MDERSKVLVNLLASGVSGGIGAALTNPLEVLKVRFQVSHAGAEVTMRAFARGVVAAEGAGRGLCTPGLSANAGGIGVSSRGRVLHTRSAGHRQASPAHFARSAWGCACVPLSGAMPRLRARF